MAIQRPTMLVNLTINDLAVVKGLDLDLQPGMSALTGETGAGKSILLTALGLALGDRADADFVRPNCSRAEINLEFDLADAPDAFCWLKENELDEEQHCVIRRIVNQDGRSKAYINNRPVTLQALQEFSEKLVEIHGQHAHLHLLRQDEQRRLLDAFGKHQRLLDEANDCYRCWQSAHKELAALAQSSRDQAQREELLRFQIDELQQLDLKHYDYAALSDEHNRLAHLEKILSVGQTQLDLLYENDEQSISQMLSFGVRELAQIAKFAPELMEISSLLTEAQIQTEEAALQLRRFLEAQEADPARMEKLENQLGLIQNLSRKHHVAPDALPELADKLVHELDGITHSSERMDALQIACDQWLKQYCLLAAQLSQARRKNAETLQQQISAMIKELGMPNGEFLVEISGFADDTPKLNGLDNINFLVSANPGLPAKPLAKVASGGELSRISLAIQVTTSSDKTTPTMIFDEVDSGIGGGIAEVVGQKLRALGKDRQVICVTHLPQVAAQAHHHLYVAKNNLGDVTASTVKLLNEAERVEELARMLGGVNITANTRAHAKEMLTLGNQN